MSPAGSRWIKQFGNTISYNNSLMYGAGISVFDGEHNIEGNVITNNTAQGNGGGIYISGGSNTIINNTISENIANEANGEVFTSAAAPIPLREIQ